MALLNDILEWTASLPAWQRDACRRLFIKGNGLEINDYSELYALLKIENGIRVSQELKSVPLAREHLPAKPAPGEKITLVALRELRNVNQIPDDSILTFSETGMTVIYGGNGSGKSGYARVMKRACRARDQSELIYPNAYDPKAVSRVPTATFVTKEANSSKEILWTNDTISHESLSTISVFDAKCARSYINSEHEVAYLPYGLDIVENLAHKVLPTLSGMLETEIDSIDIDILPFSHLLGETEVGKVIRELSAKSDVDIISALGKITDKDCNRITQLDLALKETDPISRANELKLSALRLKGYAEKLSIPLDLLSTDMFEKLQKLINEKNAAEVAEKIAADKLQAGENLLPGTGSQAWILLFEAARRYSTEIAFTDSEFPPLSEDKVCPLCQEHLGKTGIQRLKRFDEYIKNDVAKTAEAARRKVEKAKISIESTDLRIIPEEALTVELNGLDKSLTHKIEEFQVSIESIRTSIVECLKNSKWTEMTTFGNSPRSQVRQLAAHQLKTYRTLIRATNEEQRKELRNELNELVARKNLASSLKAVLELLDRMKKKELLEGCRSSLQTRTISDKSKELATAAVTSELKKALDQEFKKLGIGHIKTKLKERSIKGKIFHQLLLDLPINSKIDEILSEGEQRAIALGSFFAELVIANQSSGIVFDDPVSSLDHWRRRDVARRLVEEAKNRQVIVLTHDTSFLGQLCDEIEAAGIPNLMSFLEWQGGYPGYVNKGLPWDHQGYKARIDSLEYAQSALAKNWPLYPGEREINEMRHQYDRLRATLERVIQDVVFNGVVKRYRDWIRVDNLKEVVGFDHKEYEAIDKLHKRCCDIVTAHDHSSDKAAVIPAATDLGNDIIKLKTIVETIKDRRKMKTPQ